MFFIPISHAHYIYDIGGGISDPIYKYLNKLNCF